MINKNKNIIVLSGKKGSGKDTFADIFKRSKLIQELNDGIPFDKIIDYKVLSFASPIKYILSYLTKRTIEDLDSNKNYELYHGKTVRDYYRLIADAFKEIFSEDIWVGQLISSMNENDRYIITDLRFKNEYNILLKYFNPIFIRIKRDVEDDQHKSETDLDDIPDDEFDFIIDNNGDIDSLKLQTNKLIEKINDI